MRGILTYHSIDDSGSPISVHPDAFERHLRWFKSGRVMVTTIEELVELPASADAVAVTFDDGFVNFAEAAAPRLLAEDVPVTLFVVTDRVGSSNHWSVLGASGIPDLPLLGWPALGRLREQGVRFGAHTRTHADLTRLSQAEVEEEVRGSADDIERETGVRPTTFAYPYGSVDSAVAAIVEAEYRYGCTTELRVLDSVVPARLPRLDMYYFQGRRGLDEWGTPAFRRMIRLRNQLRRVRRLIG